MKGFLASFVTVVFVIVFANYQFHQSLTAWPGGQVLGAGEFGPEVGLIKRFFSKIWRKFLKSRMLLISNTDLYKVCTGRVYLY
jgi:hypothetical protein